MKKLWRIGGVMVGIGAVVALLISHFSANDYNDYISRLRPHMSAQDRLAEEMSATRDAQALDKLPGYIERAKEIEKAFKDLTPQDEELAELHQHLVNRAVSFVAYCEAMKVAYEAQLDKDITEIAMGHARQAKAHLDAFVEARNAYGKKHNITFEDE